MGVEELIGIDIKAYVTKETLEAIKGEIKYHGNVSVRLLQTDKEIKIVGMEKVVTLFNMGDNPDEVDIRHIGIELHIYAKGRHMATVSGVHDNIQREKNYPGHFTDVVVDRYDDKDKKREVIITLVHKKALTVEEIELTRPICPKCGERAELVDGCVFFYIYKCPKCGEETKK